MRVVTKANENKPKPILRICPEIWNAVTDRQPMSAHVSPNRCPNVNEFQRIAREIGSRTAIKNKLI